MGTDNGRGVVGHTLAWPGQALEAERETTPVNLAEVWGWSQDRVGQEEGSSSSGRVRVALTRLPNVLPGLSRGSNRTMLTAKILGVWVSGVQVALFHAKAGC